MAHRAAIAGAGSAWGVPSRELCSREHPGCVAGNADRDAQKKKETGGSCGEEVQRAGRFVAQTLPGRCSLNLTGSRPRRSIAR